MLTSLKALLVILVLAWGVFYLVRPVCLTWMTLETFQRRRNVWLALTIVAFLSPAFWIYALFAIGLLSWAGVRDENPLALYALVIFTIPEVRYYIPGLLVNQLFDLSQYRILSLAIVVPTIFRAFKLSAWEFRRGLRAGDLLLAALLVLQLVLQMPYESFTATMRHAFLATIDVFVIYYAFSRLSSLQRISDVMVCFWLAVAIMAPIAIFEWLRTWLLYTDLAERWGDANTFAFLFRGGSLRAQAAANHSINLSYMLAMSLGVYMYLRCARSIRKPLDIAVILTFCVALFATGSRGGWVTAMIAAVVFALFRPGALGKIGGAAAICLIVGVLMYFSPLKESVIDRLPIIGTSDQDTIEYRQQLAEVSWILIRQNPFFGSPFAAQSMESLRQGQGIIDIVNGYIFTALFSGLVGLALQVMIFLVSIATGGAMLLRTRRTDPEAAMLGASLTAALIATLFYVATAGWNTTAYMIAGLLVSYATVAVRRTFPSPERLSMTPLGLHARGGT